MNYGFRPQNDASGLFSSNPVSQASWSRHTTWASALRHADLPPSFETARLELVAHRSDGNREFVRLLELCVTHSVEAVEAALDQARRQGGWSSARLLCSNKWLNMRLSNDRHAQRGG